MKKKFLIGGSIVLGVAIIVTGLFLGLRGQKDLPKYFIIHGILEYEGRSYTQQVSNLIAVNLGEQIGITDIEQQVFEIKGQNQTEWVCVRIDGTEEVYRYTAAQHLDINRFKADKIIVKQVDDLVGAAKTVVSQEVVSAFVGDLTDDNLVAFPETYSEAKQVNLISSTFPGLSYILTYIHDSENGNCFVYESSSDRTWKTGHALMEAIM
jgi:hypothetical protein